MGNKESKPKKDTKPSPEDEAKESLILADPPKLSLLLQQAEAIALNHDHQVILARLALKRVPALHAPLTIKVLDLSYNRLRSIPPELGALELLETLNLSFNQIQFRVDPGKVNEDSINTLTKFKHLQRLDILFSSQITEYISLIRLHLSWNMIPSIQCFAYLSPTLQHLDLHHNIPISRIPDLSNLRSLAFLDVSECSIPALPDNLGSLPLVDFLAHNNQLKQIPLMPHSLRKLVIFNNPLSGVGNSLRNCSALTHLDMKANAVKNPEDLGLENLVSLSYLGLGPSDISALPESIVRLSNLTSLELQGTKILAVPAGITELANLNRLVLRNADIKDLETLCGIRGLTMLDLAGNKLDQLPATIANLSELVHLNLSFNNFTDISVDIARLPKLQYLFIDENPLEDPELRKLAETFNFRAVLAYARTKHGIEPHPQQATELQHPAEIPRVPHPDLAKIKIPEGATTLSPEQLRDKIMGLVFGAALGDAVGLATEFLNTKQSSFYYGRERFEIERTKYCRDRHRGRWEAGDWTDDTDQMILIMENILEHNGTVDVPSYALNLIKWAYSGFHELGDEGGLGIGQTVKNVLYHKEFITNPHKAAFEVWDKAGRNLAANGAVMRTSILGVPNFNDLNTVINNTNQICLVTHADPRCQASCVAVTVAIALLLQGISYPRLFQAQDRALELLKDNEPHTAEFIIHINANIKELELAEQSKIGYTFKSLGCGFLALRKDAFEEAMMEIMWESGDADTNAAVAGAMLGCKLGYSNLPARWVNSLLHREWLQHKVFQLFDLMGL